MMDLVESFFAKSACNHECFCLNDALEVQLMMGSL
jgi:hypothetical protein